MSCSESKEAWNRFKEVWHWTRAHPKSQRTELQQDIVRAYWTVLYRWLLRAFGLFLLVGLVKMFWNAWGRLFDLLLDLAGL